MFMLPDALVHLLKQGIRKGCILFYSRRKLFISNLGNLKTARKKKSREISRVNKFPYYRAVYMLFVLVYEISSAVRWFKSVFKAFVT